MQNDHLGTPQQLLNPEGAVVHRQRMEAYGRSVRNGEEQSLRFAGQVEDAHSGTYYNFHRNYEARSGSYTQWDPIGLNGGINTYNYVGSSPLMFIDPLGLKARVCCRKIPYLPAAHCFIQEEKDDMSSDFCGPLCESKKRTLGLQGPSPFGSSTNGAGETRVDDGFDKPGNSRCGEWKTDCALSSCLDKEFANYANPSNYSGPWGPNSNTFAFTLASRCGLKAPSKLWPTPGWGQSPAGPPTPPVQ